MKTFLPHGSPVPQFGDEVWGVVVAVQANFYQVQIEPQVSSGQRSGSTEDAGVTGLKTAQQLLCTRRSRLKKIGQQVMVGDRVRVDDPDWAGGRGAIAAVYPRQTMLDRPPMANADQLLLMFALAEPELDHQQLSRFLVKAEATGLAVRLCLNKQDLVSLAERQRWQARLAQWGYEAMVMSVQAGDVLGVLKPQLQGRITVVSGPSGVGKSSLINQLIPQATLRTGAVSGKLGRGRHTTRHVELFELPGGGFLADTPGFNQPDLELTPGELGNCFPEIRQRLAQAPCQFNDCLHRHEPGCAVGADWDRHDIYLTLLDEVLAAEPEAYHRQERDAALKMKMGDMGQVHHEPRLPAKTYRRVSRRRQNQTLDELRYDLPQSVAGVDDWDDLDDDLG